MYATRSAIILAGIGLAASTLLGGSTASAATKPAASAAPSSIDADDLLSQSDLVKFTKLPDYKTLTRPAPPQGNGHNYRYSTTTNYWSVIALDPSKNLNMDLRLYSDKAETDLLAESTWHGDSTEFITVNSNVDGRPFGSYYGYASKLDNTGPYEIQVAQGANVLDDGNQDVVMTAKSSTVAIRDTWLEAGEQYRFTLSPSNRQMIGSIWLMSSNAHHDVVPKSDYDNAEIGEAGDVVIMEHVAPKDGWYGLVILSEGGNGTFELSRQHL